MEDKETQIPNTKLEKKKNRTKKRFIVMDIQKIVYKRLGRKSKKEEKGSLWNYEYYWEIGGFYDLGDPFGLRKLFYEEEWDPVPASFYYYEELYEKTRALIV